MSDFSKTTEIMEEAIGDGVFPSAALLVGKKGKVLFKKYFGNCSEDTIFDVASLTKPVITTTLSMIAVSEGLIKLDDELEKFFPEADNLRHVKISNLLNHSSGLTGWRAYHQEIPEGEVASVAGRKQIIDAILREQLEYKTGTKSVYSDLGFILLGVILEDVFSEPLNILAEEAVLNPLGMKNSFYRLVNKTPWSGDNFEPAYVSNERDFSNINFAPTEDCPWRGEVVRGIVHDQNCYAMGGVAGHAGLFSTIDDLNTFAAELVKCKNGESSFVKKEIADQFIDPYTSKLAFHHPGTFLLGWDRPARENSQAGSKFSENSVGHLGYTGTSLWIDMERDTWIILLTNRIHPTPTNQKIKTLRPILHDRIWEEILGTNSPVKVI